MAKNQLYTVGYWGQCDQAAVATIETITENTVAGTVSHRGGIPVPFLSIHRGGSFQACGHRFYFEDWIRGVD